MDQFVLVIHGGAGTLRRELMDPGQEAAHRDALLYALAAGREVLAAGGASLDAVVATVVALEECPLFNAGKGAVFTHARQHELDAAVMDGASGAAGAVAGVRTVRNPVLAARRVMAASGHVMLAGAGAEAFAREQGLEIVHPGWFSTPVRLAQLLAVHESGRAVLDHDAPGAPDKFGTVGAVALDTAGRLAAATSTGGLTNKRYGRVGDTPVIGAGTWADTSVAVSATGTGEAFIRTVAAYDVAARMRYLGCSLAQAAAAVVHEAVPAAGGDGGLIAIDRHGNIAMPFNTAGMYRGHVAADAAASVAIYR
jgi:beta-aspartyl-peptidase (threonine type)